jgi:hypothetical protein
MAGNSPRVSPSGTPSRQSFVGRYLDPTESLGEVLFGLIMVLTFTLGAGVIAEEVKESTTRMLLGIVGCNVAWGLIDGGIYVISSMFDRSRKARLLQSIQKATSEEDALAMVGRELDPRLEPFTSFEERKRLYPAILKRLVNVMPERTRVKKDDIYGAIAVFWLVFYSTIPAAAPFLVFSDRFVALRASNLLLLAMLSLVGYRWARATNSNPWIFASILLLVGLAMVSIAMALGG